MGGVEGRVVSRAQPQGGGWRVRLAGCVGSAMT